MLGYRKFALAVLTILCATGLMWFGKIADGVYSTIVVAVVGGYLASNVFTNPARDIRVTGSSNASNASC